MDVERLATKLAPLKPEEVARWQRSRDTADASLKALLDRRLILIARRVLGNPHKLLLSLPPVKKARGEIRLGSILYEKEKWPAGISGPELLQNLAVFGRSGAGKTNTVFHLLLQLDRKRIPFLFLDWKRTCRHLLPALKRPTSVFTPGRSLAPFRFNPFISPPGMERHVYLAQVVDVMADAFTLGDGARSVLQRALKAAYVHDQAPTAQEVLRKVEAIPDKERVRGWKISAVRALESLVLSELVPRERVSQEELVRGLLERSTILELDSLSQSGKRFLIPLLCLWLYYVKLSSSVREQLSLVIVVEEAHHVLHRHTQPARESVMEMLLRQCREIGIGIIVVDQHPHLMSSAALGNTYTSLCLNLKDPKDIAEAAALSLVEEGERACFSTLPVGQAVVKLQDRWMRPFLVRMPAVDVRKGAVTDAVVRRLSRGDLTRSGMRRVGAGDLERVQRVRLDDDPLKNDDLAFVRDVLDHPEEGVKARYERLGWSVGRGNDVKERLIASGWLESATVPVGMSRKVILRPSSLAMSVFGINSSSAPRESLAHEYWKYFYARKYRSDGYGVRLEAPRVAGGRVDVLAEKEGDRIGIEIETGKSDVVRNVKSCLRSRFDRVVVVATDPEASERVERALGRAGLLVRGRVWILVGDSG